MELSYAEYEFVYTLGYTNFKCLDFSSWLLCLAGFIS